MKPTRRRRIGFTLLEVLMAITIIALICGLIVSFARLTNQTARRQQARSELANWGEALHRWHARFGEYPGLGGDENGSPVNELYDHVELLDFDEPDPIPRRFFEQTGSGTNADVSANSLLPLSLKDPWGMDYRYRRLSEDDYELWSCGPDSRSQTSDDIHLNP